VLSNSSFVSSHGMSEENNWYARLLNEKSSLDEKIKKLNHFLGGDKSNTVNPDEVVLLRLQLKYMKTQSPYRRQWYA
jgi:uncharacterized protein YdcH (DUF465 family)